jgi:hypothetical protein
VFPTSTEKGLFLTFHVFDTGGYDIDNIGKNVRTLLEGFVTGGV